MDYRNNAYGIGQRRQPNNDASSFAPIRSGGGGGGSSVGIGSGINDNYRGQSMNYGRLDGFNNGNNNNLAGNSYAGNNNNQRFTDIDKKFGGSVQLNNYAGRAASDNVGYNNNSNVVGYSNQQQQQQRFSGGNNNNSNNNNRVAENGNVAANKLTYFDDNFRGQQQRYNISDNNRNTNNLISRATDNFVNKQQQQPQAANLGLARSLSDLSYNNSNNNNNNNQQQQQQRFYNNDRNDTFRRSDNFNDIYRSGNQNSGNFVGRTNSNFNVNNSSARSELPFGPRSNSGGNFGNFDNNISSSYRNNQQQQQQQSNGFIGPQNDGFNPQIFRGQHNNNNSAVNDNDTQSLAVFTETVNALMNNQPNWIVGNNNDFGLNQSNFNGNRQINRPNPAQLGNNKPPFQSQNKVFKPMNNNNNKAQQPQLPNSNRNKPTQPGFKQFPANPTNRNLNQRGSNMNVNNTAGGNKNKPNPNQPNKQQQQQTQNNPAAKNANAGQKPKVQPPPPKANPSASNTQAKNTNTNINTKKPEVKKETPTKVAGQKRVADPAPVPLTKADIKRRKLAIKRGFLLGGFKLNYINNKRTALPQPEDKSYAIMFFEQTPNYSTSGEELDDNGVPNVEESIDVDGKNAGRTLVKRIRKRLHYEWTQMEEEKKYKCWPTWWTDYKWCEAAIKEQLDTFGSINLRDCFIPDLPRLSTEEVVDVIVKSGQFGLEKNSDNYFNNMKSIFTLMNVTFLENLKMPNIEIVQDMIRAVPNDFWSYKMRSMVYLWAQYLKISKTSSPSTENGAKELQAIARDWKNPLFHWIAKQAFDELKAISEVEWPEHKQLYAGIESAIPKP